MNLFYRSEGNGIPIIILHGLYGSSDNWLSIARRLKPFYNVITVDLRNHGNSPHSSDFTYGDMVTDLAWTLSEIGVESAHFLGHSMGGKVAMAFAADYPEKIISLAIADIAPVNYLSNPASSIQYNFHRRVLDALSNLNFIGLIDRNAVDNELRKSIPEIEVRSFILKNLRKRNDGAFEWKINVPVLHKQLDHIISGVDYIDYMDRIPITNYPVLFIKGGLSGYISEDNMIAISKMYPNARIEQIENTSHFLHAEKPDDFADVYLKFLKIVG